MRRCQQAAEVSISTLVFGEERQVLIAGDCHFCADDRMDATLLRRFPKSDRAGEIVVVSQRDCRESQTSRVSDEVFR